MKWEKDKLIFVTFYFLLYQWVNDCAEEEKTQKAGKQNRIKTKKKAHKEDEKWSRRRRMKKKRKREGNKSKKNK